MRSAFTVSVPATSANLGPGFDAIGLAVDLFVRATVVPAERFSLHFVAGHSVPTNSGFENEIVRAMERVLGSGERPAIAITIENDIPLGKGLGASAAGAVLGATIGAQLARERPSQEELAQIVCTLEGHPDNALPALLGGIVIAAMPEGAPPQYLRFDPPPSLYAVVAVPQIVLPTAAARALLPAHYERRDVVFNLQRVALLAASFAGGDLRALRAATADRIHQPYRAPLVPGFAEMLGFDLPGLLSVTLSGAGPSVLALATENSGAIGAAMHAAFAREGIESTVLSLRVTTRGAEVTPVGAAA
ncbi:MAG TPA: homoserine kinase [Candidatus Acidoferrales bacterium]|nr:homoserine kinase [Candidatus Acidoferrales bacterium]